MNPSFAACAFKLHLPQCEVFDDHLKIKYKLDYQKGNTEKIMFYYSVLVDKFKENHICENNKQLFLGSNFSNTAFNFLEFVDGKEIYVKDALLKMFFLSDKGEKNVYQKNLFSPIPAIVGPDDNHPKEDEEEYDFDVSDIPGLEKYGKALKTEKLFLMHEGGRQYKVTNGKLVSKVKGVFSYIFDLETELHISDDAPIKISTGGQKTSGSVLMCEDFQMENIMLLWT